MADFLNGLFFSEILADNAGGQAVDVDGDGNTNKADEYIEIGNASGASISLDGIEIWSETNGLLFSFGPGDTLGAGEAATVLGNYTGTPPVNFYSAGIPENGNFIPDGEGQRFDTIFLVDTNTGEYITLSYGQPPRPITEPTGFPGTTQLGSGEAINSNSPNGVAISRDANGTLQEGTPTPGTPSVACFTLGTIVLTKRGPRCISQLRPGDLIQTRDHGPQRLLGIQKQRFTARDLLRRAGLRPVQIPADLLGGHPATLLSPAHCILFQHEMAELLFGEAEVFVRAAAFARCALGSRIIPPRGIVYVHLAFEQHEVLCADGVWSESYLARNRQRVSEAKWQFAQGITHGDISHERPCRRVLKRSESQVALDLLRVRQSAADMPLRKSA